MTTVLARTRVGGAALAAILLLAVAGCGGDDGGDSTSAPTQAAATQAGGSAQEGSGTETSESGGGGDFCEQLQNVDDEILTTPDPTNAADIAKTFDDAAGALADVSAPGEIQEDWDTLVSTFRGWADAFEGIDLSDPDALAEAQDALSAIQDDQQKLLDATQRISEYAADTCGIDLGPGS